MATVHIAIPVQDELECLPACLDALRRQEGVRFVTWLCVNQPEAWQHEPDRRPVCEANQACLHLLADVTDLDLRIIDRSSPGPGLATEAERCWARAKGVDGCDLCGGRPPGYHRKPRC